VNFCHSDRGLNDLAVADAPVLGRKPYGQIVNYLAVEVVEVKLDASSASWRRFRGSGFWRATLSFPRLSCCCGLLLRRGCWRRVRVRGYVRPDLGFKLREKVFVAHGIM